ncbi:MAG: hypothetical protein AAF806_31050 [Bacteroidota bacterium]
MSNNQIDLSALIQDCSYLFWWMPEESKKALPVESIVEAILSYGNLDQVKKLFEQVGLEKTAEIFRKQIAQKRVNYKRRTQHYFNLYFNEYVPLHP